MNVKPRPGVVLTKIRGVYVLLATAEAARHCPSNTRLNLPQTMCWRLLTQGKGEAECAQLLGILFHQAPDQALDSARALLKELREKNLLIPMEAESEKP